MLACLWVLGTIAFDLYLLWRARHRRPREDRPRAGLAAAARAEAQLAAVRIRYPALPIDEREVDGTAYRVLAEQARDARLLVLGRHRAGPGVEVVLGSTEHGLVESVPCPVLIAGPSSET
jgi:nucleotide-binding universal stress UspA family protein